MSGLQMLPNLGCMHATVVPYSRDIKCRAAFVRPTFHRSRIKFPEIQSVTERDPSYCAGIADKNLEPSELILN